MPFHQIISFIFFLLIWYHSWHFEEKSGPRGFKTQVRMKVRVLRGPMGQARAWVERMWGYWVMGWGSSGWGYWCPHHCRYSPIGY